LDNLSGETKDKELGQKNPAAVDGGDIHFEEIVEVDEIQKILKLKLDNEDSDIEFTPEMKELPKDSANNAMSSAKNNNKDNSNNVASAPPVIDYNAKKYVINIDSDNVGFVESLDPEERRDIINKILREQNELAQKAKQIAERTRFLKHSLVVTFTFIIGFPIMFFCVNKALEASMTNYEQAKQNFTKLYKQQGKIKQPEIDKALGN